MARLTLTGKRSDLFIGSVSMSWVGNGDIDSPYYSEQVCIAARSGETNTGRGRWYRFEFGIKEAVEVASYVAQRVARHPDKDYSSLNAKMSDADALRRLADILDGKTKAWGESPV